MRTRPPGESARKITELGSVFRGAHENRDGGRKRVNHWLRGGVEYMGRGLISNRQASIRISGEHWDALKIEMGRRMVIEG